MSSYLGVIDELTDQKAALEQDIEARAESLPETQCLMTCPGVSHLTDLTLNAEIGEIERFDGHNGS